MPGLIERAYMIHMNSLVTTCNCLSANTVLNGSTTSQTYLNTKERTQEIKLITTNVITAGRHFLKSLIVKGTCYRIKSKNLRLSLLVRSAIKVTLMTRGIKNT